jgi:hypothetical protein
MIPRVSPRAAQGASRALLLAAALVALVWTACASSPAADGASCDKDASCKSGRCANGACQGSDCACEGADCRGRSSCDEGWLCTLGEATTDKALPQCRKECAGVGACPSDKRCENGVCRDGAEPFALAWANLPRKAPCAARVPCDYAVSPSAGVTVDAYTWSFGDAPAVETKAPTASFTYDATGTFAVVVRARSTAGASAELRTTEILCAGGLGDACDVNSSLCCEGACVRGLCK